MWKRAVEPEDRTSATGTFRAKRCSGGLEARRGLVGGTSVSAVCVSPPGGVGVAKGCEGFGAGDGDPRGGVGEGCLTAVGGDDFLSDALELAVDAEGDFGLTVDVDELLVWSDGPLVEVSSAGAADSTEGVIDAGLKMMLSLGSGKRSD